jgi:hypothetical protein
MQEKTQLPPTPELDKIRAVQERSQSIGEFLDWLYCEKHLSLCRTHEHGPDCFDPDDNERICGLHAGEYLPFPYITTDLLAEFFHIDQAEAEKERRQLLQFITSP